MFRPLVRRATSVVRRVQGTGPRAAVRSPLHRNQTVACLGNSYSYSSSSTSSAGSGQSWSPLVAGLGALGFVSASAVAVSGQAWKDTKLYAFGRNFHGELGIGNEDNCLVPNRSKSLRSEHVQFVTAGGHSSAVINIDGELFTFGHGRDGQLGHGNDSNESLPKYVEGDLPKFVSASIGPGHVAAISEDGVVWTAGSGRAGQLGDGKSESRSTLGPIPKESFGGQAVVQVGVSDEGTIALTSSGDVYYFGETALAYGRPGHSSPTGVSRPERVSERVKGRVVAVAAGAAHFLMLTDEGRVWAFGAGESGQLGDGSRHAEWNKTPKLIRALRDTVITSIAAGDFHCLAIGQDGLTWSWGRNSEGQLGLGHVSEVPIPARIRDLGDLKASKVVAGSSHSIVYGQNSSTGVPELYGFGKGRDGQIGRGDVINRRSPVRIASFDKTRIIDIAAGAGHTLVLLSSEEVSESTKSEQ